MGKGEAVCARTADDLELSLVLERDASVGRAGRLTRIRETAVGL